MSSFIPIRVSARQEEKKLLPGASLTSMLFTLAFCLCLTAFFFQYTVRQDEERVESYVEGAVQSIAAATMQATFVNPVFDALMVTFARVQQDVANGVPMSQQQFQTYLWAQPVPGLETTSLQLLPRIAGTGPDARDNATRMLGDNERAQLPILEPNGNGARLATIRNEYFPVLREASYGITVDIPGMDRSTAPAHQLAMLQARDTGMLGLYSSFPATNLPGEEQVSHYYMPLYEGGLTPSTVAERREKLIGFVAAYTRYPASVMFDLLPQAYHGIEATFVQSPPGGESLMSLHGNIENYLQSSAVKLASYRMQGIDFTLAAKGSASLQRAMQTTTRWWVVGLGLLLTLWMQSMLFWSHLQSKKIVALVNERTRDLAERTTALTEANHALRQSEMRYRVLADNVSDVIYTCDFNGICTYISPSVQDQNGYSVDEYIGYPIYRFLEPASAELARSTLEKASKVLLDPEVQGYVHEIHEYETLCKYGGSKAIESTMDVLFGDNDRPIGFLGVVRDITERKKAEKEKENLQLAYRQAQKMEAVGTLAGGIAHDFNNLLTGILGHSELLKSEYGGNSEAHRSVELIEMAATRAKDLTSQLLGFARKGKFMLVPVEINPILCDLVDLIERTVDKNIVIHRVSCADNPTVLGDPGQISQIFLNLAVNARDAMPKGGRLTFKTEIQTLDNLTATTTLGLAAGQYCVISVSDTGIGIAKDKIERIFEPFFTDKEEGKGTGLGLAMVYGVVKNHKGAVNVYSEVGAGSNFKVYLPLHDNRTGEKRKSLARTVVKGTGNILLVDDQPVVRQVGEKMLSQLGYKVMLADNGETGLAYYREHWRTIDIVMIDLIMPRMGGLECLEEMKKLNPALKSILSTGFSREDIAGKINESHILGFIQKPYRVQELSEVIAGVKRRDQ
ncbi:MAG: ATP-binding protein [Pseudomonadota bacterium]